MKGFAPVHYAALVFALMTANVFCTDHTTPPEDAGNCGGALGTYVLTPNAPNPPPPDHAISDHYIYHSKELDQGGGPQCDLVIYEDCPDEDNNYFQFSIGIGCGGSNAFSARVNANGGAYEFFGTWLRPYNSPTLVGPFAGGSYTGPNGEGGTFQFYEEGRTP